MPDVMIPTSAAGFVAAAPGGMRLEYTGIIDTCLSNKNFSHLARLDEQAI